jgi:CHAT domain-containing protein
MKPLSLLAVIVFTVSISCTVNAQGEKNSIVTEEEIIYQAYIDQVKTMLSARGMADSEIEEVISQYRNNNIKSDKDLAKVLGKLYPSDRNIAIIFYFFKNDSLRVSLFEPGKIIEQTKISITEKKLLSLSDNINRSLNLYEQSASRAPRLRGVTIKSNINNKQISFDKAIDDASSILLPKKFTNQYKHLLVIPAYNISAIPFHLLKANDDKKFLVEYCSYSIAPSIVDLIVLRYKMLKKHLGDENFGFIRQIFSIRPEASYDEEMKNKVLHSLDLLHFDLDNPLFVSNPAYPTNGEFVFPDLQGAKKEIDSAKKYASTYKLFEGEKATKDSIMYYLPKADLAYFATHGIANNESPMEKSFLVLSGSNAFLTAKDIMDTRLKKRPFPEMVVLSACQTGLGKFTNAGTVGLARAFLIAGSNHVVMSLWNVDDEATAFLMSRFMWHLKNENAHLPSGALRLAILDTKKQYPNPSKWASFTVFGVDF